MAEQDRKIADLYFGFSDKEQAVSNLNAELDKLTKKSTDLNKSFSFNINVDSSTMNTLNSNLEKVLNNYKLKVKDNAEFTEAQSKSIAASAIKYANKAVLNERTIQAAGNKQEEVDEKKHQNNMTEIKEKEEQKRQTAAYKSTLKQEEYNNRIEKSTKTMYDKISEYAKTYLVYQGFNELKSAAQEAVEAMKSVEYRMMEISRIMEEGSINVEKYRDELIQLAYDYGRSFDDVSTVTLNFARAGYDANDSLAMTEQSLLALNTAELDAEQSTEGLISILAQWDMNTGTTAEKSQNLANVIDKINKTADEFPISSEGLLEALKRTSQGFNLAGATIDETIAMIVAAESASQRGGKVIGTAMANMQQQLKAEGKLDLAKSLGLDLFEDEAETTFKSVTEIFSLMSERMQELENAGKGSSTEMQSLLELFTVFRRNIGAGLLSEMSGEDSTYLKALTNSLESAGYSAQENSKYMGTMEAATQQLNATILKLQSTLYDEGGKSIFTGFILGAEGGINAINSLIENFGVLPTTIGAVTLAFGLLNKKMSYEGLKKYANNLKDLGSAFDLYNTQVKTGAETTEDLYELMGKKATTGVKKYVDSLNGADASISGYIAHTVTATAKQLALNLAIAAGEAAISFGLSFAIQAIVGAIQDWINATDIAAESVAEMNDNLNTTTSELETYSNKFKSLKTEMVSGKLTQEEYNAAQQDLLEIQDELIEKYGKEAKEIDLVNGKLDEQIQKIESLAKADYKKYIQENKKEIDKLTKTFSKDETQIATMGIKLHAEVPEDFYKTLREETQKLGGGAQQTTTGIDVIFGGKIEDVLEKYRQLYDNIDKYRQNAEGKDAEYADNMLTTISSKIKKLEDKYGDNLETYKEYLNNKLQYEEYYSSVYGQILKSRADLSKAIASGDDEAIEKAQEDLKNIYKNAIDLAKKDPDVADGMTELLQEQIDNLNKSTDIEQIKLKIGIDAEEIHESIQDIISDMGDISFEDLEEGLGAETLTENMAKLKTVLDENGVSVQDLVDNFEYLGFTMGVVTEETEENLKGWESYNTLLENSLTSISCLSNSYATLLGIQQQYNSTGYLTAEMYDQLLANNGELLQYLQFENGQLQINTQAMLNLAEAKKVEAIQTLQAAQAEDILNLAMGNIESLSPLAKSAIGEVGDKASEAAGEMTSGAAAANLLAAGLQNVNDAAAGELGEGVDVEQFKKDAQKIIDAYQGLANSIANTKITSPKYNPQIATALNNASSSAKNNAQREAEEAAKAAQKAEEEAYKARLEQFTDYIDEKERLEKRWVSKQKELGLLSNEDYMYITQQRIERYKKYLDEVKKATWMAEEDRLKLIKEYSEEIEDLQVDYIGYLEDQLKDEIEAFEDATDEKIKLIEQEADARIAALDKVTEATDRARKKEDYESERQSILDEIAYWQQRTGREAQESLKEAKKRLAELDEEWAEQLEDWSIEDQIEAIEEERDAQISAIEDAEAAEIEALKAIYDAKVKMFAETGEIIYEGTVIQAQSLYNAYKTNFIDPVASDLANLNKTTTTTTAQTTQQQQQYETYTIKAGDTLSKIAKKYGTTVEKLMAANPYITNKNKIYAGKSLQIPKFHEGGIVGGSQEAFALLKPNEVILKTEWAASLNRMMKYFDGVTTGKTNGFTNGSTIEVKGNLIQIDADIKSKSDVDYLERRIEKMLKSKFNIKK